jgi:hypothetical protein
VIVSYVGSSGPVPAPLREIGADCVDGRVDVVVRHVTVGNEARRIQDLREDPAFLEPRLERRAIGFGELREHHVRRMRQHLHLPGAREPVGEMRGVRVIVREALEVVLERI